MHIDNSGDLGIRTNTPTQALDVNGAIAIGNTSSDVAGSIRWNGTNFEGYNGVEWKKLDESGGGSLSGQGKCIYWPEYPNAVFWRGTGVDDKAIRASASYDSTTGQTYYLIEKQDGLNVQNYRMIVIWHPPDDYNYSNNSSTQFTLNYELGSGGTITSVKLKTADGSSVNDIGPASLTSNKATLTNFTGLGDGEWVVIDIEFNVDDGQSVKLYDIQITYDR